jgi:hypothetical protein
MLPTAGWREVVERRQAAFAIRMTVTAIGLQRMLIRNGLME